MYIEENGHLTDALRTPPILDETASKIHCDKLAGGFCERNCMESGLQIVADPHFQSERDTEAESLLVRAEVVPVGRRGFSGSIEPFEITQGADLSEVREVWDRAVLVLDESLCNPPSRVVGNIASIPICNKIV